MSETRFTALAGRIVDQGAPYGGVLLQYTSRSVQLECDTCGQLPPPVTSDWIGICQEAVAHAKETGHAVAVESVQGTVYAPDGYALPGDANPSAPVPQPEFPHHAYGVKMTWIGDEGAMAALGHVPERRFIAACNSLARAAGLTNPCDHHGATLEDFLDCMTRVWAAPIRADPGEVWAVRYDTSARYLPGAFPITLWDPA